MSLQYVEPTASSFPLGIFAKTGGGGNQKPGEGAGKPSFKKATKKAAKAAKKKKK
jgi:hypothetical protein